jgi:chemotaxis protein CheD
MSRLETKLPVLYLKPAEIYMADSPSIVKTVLGSCVSITMFNHRLKVGAICHGLLPHCKGKTRCKGACNAGFKYVDCSIRHMLEQFSSLGIGHREIEVKLFGGADMFRTGAGERETVGAQNTQTALRIIEKEHLNLCKTDTGGDRGRKIFFYTHTGEIFLKRLGRSERGLTADVMRAENQMRTAALGKSCQDRTDDSPRLTRGGTRP